MKKKIHPAYQTDATIHCACGQVFTVGSTQERTDVETCSNCHPFYTGKQKLMDTAGRVDRFQRLMGKKQAKPAKKK